MLDKHITSSLDEIINLSKTNQYKINSITLYNFYVDLQKGYPDIEIMEEMNDYISQAGIEIIYDGVEVEDTLNDNEKYEIKPFDPSKIDIDSKPLTLDSLVKRIENNEVNLNTNFQRKSGLWTTIQKSQLIESLLLRIPLPAFYFDAGNDDNWLIIDGLQRVTAIKEFIVDKSLRLTGLEFFTDLNDKTYTELPRNFRRRIEETEIITYRVKSGTPANVKYNIFKRINTGGLELTPQEIRHALYQGQASDFLIELASSESFKTATSNSIRTDRMMDREFVLRYVGVCYYGIDHYQGLPDEFLNGSMEFLNHINEDMLHDIHIHFNRTMQNAYNIMGRHTFRKIPLDMRRCPINKAIFEMWCYALNNLTAPELTKLKRNRKELKQDFINLCTDESFLAHIKSSAKSSYQKRFPLITELIGRYL